MKRLFDSFVAAIGLFFLSPFLMVFMFLVWLEDRHTPLYISNRIGRGGKNFKMVKLRSMIINADTNGVDSTSASDSRITKVGVFIRKFKLDEFTQLWNVLIGDMSLVGPRPNVKAETDKYTRIEKGLLNIRPGITDFSSIIFSDEGEILDGRDDPDLAYNQLIRPWKSRLGLIYIDTNNLLLDLKIIFITIIAIISRKKALMLICNELKNIGVAKEVLNVASRKSTLIPSTPPGSD